MATDRQVGPIRRLSFAQRMAQVRCLGCSRWSAGDATSSSPSATGACFEAGDATSSSPSATGPASRRATVGQCSIVQEEVDELSGDAGPSQ